MNTFSFKFCLVFQTRREVLWRETIVLNASSLLLFWVRPVKVGQIPKETPKSLNLIDLHAITTNSTSLCV